MSNQISACLQGVNIYDEQLVNKYGLGCGCDITQSIGMGNCKTQILDYDLLMNDKVIEIDNNQERYKISRTGDDYAKMTNEINSCLVGKTNIGVGKMSFGWNLTNSLNSKTEQMDMYEYGMTMIIQKMYALNIKPSLYNKLKDYINVIVWNEINASNENDRTDIKKIKELYKKYGTHISTKAFYGSLYQYFLYREKNEWESSIKAQLKIGADAKVPNAGKGISINSDYNCDITETDKECYKHSYKEETDRRIGGDVSISNFDEWLASCTPEKPESCALLGYALGIGANEDSGLIPLYELLENGDERKDAMSLALEEYINENSIQLTTPKMVIVDAYGKNFKKGKAPEFIYEKKDGKSIKYYRLNENILNHISAATDGEYYFYYALGHLVGEAVVDMSFDNSTEINGDWKTRGDDANNGVYGYLSKRYLCVKTKNVKNGIPENEFITGFGIKIEKTIKSISKGTSTDYNWIQKGEDWFKGLAHEKIHCVYTKDKLAKF